MRDLIRTVRLSPYVKGYGPSFTLRVYSTGRYDHRGCSRLDYTLTQRERGKSRVIFDGGDFCPSPMYADDSDDAIGALLGFLTLRPGDTDREYFERYTPEQLEFASQHAESLACYCLDRFGDR